MQVNSLMTKHPYTCHELVHMKYYKEAFTGIRSFMHKTSMIRFAPTLENRGKMREVSSSQNILKFYQKVREFCVSQGKLCQKKKSYMTCVLYTYFLKIKINSTLRKVSIISEYWGDSDIQLFPCSFWLDLITSFEVINILNLCFRGLEKKSGKIVKILKTSGKSRGISLEESNENSAVT